MEAQKNALVEGIKSYVIPEGCVIARDTGDFDQCGRCNIYFYVRPLNDVRCRECNSSMCDQCWIECKYAGVFNHSYYYSTHFVYCSDTCHGKNVAKLKKQKTLLNRLK